MKGVELYTCFFASVEDMRGKGSRKKSQPFPLLARIHLTAVVALKRFCVVTVGVCIALAVIFPMLGKMFMGHIGHVTTLCRLACSVCGCFPCFPVVLR